MAASYYWSGIRQYHVDLEDGPRGNGSLHAVRLVELQQLEGMRSARTH